MKASRRAGPSGMATTPRGHSHPAMRAWRDGRGRALAAVLLVLLGAFSGCLTLWGGPQAGPPPEGNGPENHPHGAPPGDPGRPAPGGFSDTSVFPGTYRMKGNYSLTLEPGPYEIGPEQVADTPGGRVGFVLPVGAKTAKFPVIMQASPYYGPLEPGGLRASYNSNPEQSVDFLLDNYVPHGYAVVLVPVRGTSSNDGCYEWWSQAEREDLRKVVRWINQQPWSTPRIGAIGLSLGGAAAWMAAGLGEPSIKTIVPVSSETDLYTWFVRNGTPSAIAAPWGVPAYWFLYSASPYAASYPKQARDPEKLPQSVQCPGLAEAAAAGHYMALTGQPDDPAGFVQARDLRPHVEANYRGSVFLVTGLHDWLAHPHLVYPWANGLEEEGITVKHLLGQWRHRMPDDDQDPAAPHFQPTLRPDFAEILLHWFDYWLKNDRRVDLGPRVQVADSSFTWRDEARWPPPGVATQLYPTADGALAAEATAPGQVVLVPDARRSVVRSESFSPTGSPCPEVPASDITSCVFFRTEPMTEELRFAGLPGLHAKVVPGGPAGHLTAYLHVEEGGVYRLLGWATMDLRFAEGPPAQTLTPGQSMTVRLEFEPLDAVVPEGARLVLEIFQGGYGEDIRFFPREAIAPAATYRAPATNPVSVELGSPQTYLDIPVTDVRPSQFFAAPSAVKI